MSPVGRRYRRLRTRLRGPGRLRVYHDSSFRLPITSLNARHGMEVRRSDFVAWYLTIDGWLHVGDLHTPEQVTYADLARVHTESLLNGLTSGVMLAEIFHADPSELKVDEVMRSIRRACGATLMGARWALAHRAPTLSLLGGFHHAFPDKGGGLCPVNDLAVAIAALRSEGFEGQVVVLDLDAHPPDGTAACLLEDELAWVGSLSGSDWGPIPGADETVLPAGTDDRGYLRALEALLRRMPRPDLAFVIAGGDVLAGDRFGMLGLSLDGVRRRDLRVMRALAGIPSVWTPGGGYSERSWLALAGTGLALAGYGRHPVPPDIDPADLQYDRIARRLDTGRLGIDTDEDDWLGSRELEVELGIRRPGDGRMLNMYTSEGSLYAFEQYGILGHLQRLGYHDFRVAIDQAAVGDRLRLYGTDDQGHEHTLVENVLQLKEVDGRPVVFVHWLTLRHPAGTFGKARPRLPGQEVPGLGLSLEAIELLERVARRVGAEGVAFRPSYYHTAWPGSDAVRFVDDARQGRFEALVRDLGSLPPSELSRALQQGRVRMNGEPYSWEPEEMVAWLQGRDASEPAVDEERERVRFTVVE